jgi:uncharacterized protein YodC (DUF2158 family)
MDNAYWNAPPPAKARKEYDPGDMRLAVGDVVTLNSGGPAMTIEKFVPAPPIAPGGPPMATSGFAYGPNDTQAHCIWQSADGHFLDRVFWPHTISKVGGDKAPADWKEPEALDKA